MQTPREIAEAYGLVTADRIAPPARAAAGTGLQPRPAAGSPQGSRRAPPKWADFDPDKRDAFKASSYCCVVMVGADGPEPRHIIGDNRGGWPVRLAIQRIWDDNPAAAADRESPWHARVLIMRLWAEDRPEAARLRDCVESYLQERAETEEARHAWLDLGPDVDLAMLRDELVHAARRAGLSPMTDGELSRHLDGIVELWRRGGR